MEPRLSPTGPFPRLAAHIWRAPLVPVALALTAGILLDRWLDLPLAFSALATLAAVLAWMANPGARPALAIGYLWAACAALGAAYHHAARDGYADNDISHLATEEAQPVLLRGVVDTEPNYVRGSGEDPLRSFATTASTRFVLHVSQLKTAVDWIPVSGLAQVILEARIHPVHVGDRVEIVGRMILPHPPANPGEFDYPAFLRDQGIGTLVSVPPSTQSITLLAEGWPRTLHGWLGVVRGWGQEVLARHLPEKVAGVAGALLLGDDAGMTRDDWDKYARTGVIHVLAISGQHLVILSAFLWMLMRSVWVPRRRGIVLIAIFLVLYAVMSGGRPPVMRAAWAMAAYCGAVWLGRQALPANTLALAWILVIFANPSDIFSLGCQLSFLAVAMLFWGTKASALSSAFLVALPWSKPPLDPELQRLIDESRPLLIANLIRLKRWVVEFYVVNATVWLAVTPLVAGTQHMVSPVALLIGPPLVLFTSVALISGFVMLLSVPFGLAGIFSWPVHWSLAGCEYLVDRGGSLPGAYFFVADLPAWWLWAFYLALFTYLTVGWIRQRPIIFRAFTLAWALAGCAVLLGPFAAPAFSCTFLAVGHGGCTVVETADGRVLLYDAGA
ncbi:MAG TPA: ComEC/Rec2 family competence protein, partial [Gemmataceae bacterium]|nr:ComEC/Rec2 family competence protein [Gemmataceae bacterium]